VSRTQQTILEGHRRHRRYPTLIGQYDDRNSPVIDGELVEGQMEREDSRREVYVEEEGIYRARLSVFPNFQRYYVSASQWPFDEHAYVRLNFSSDLMLG